MVVMTAAAAEPRREYPGRRGLILHAQGELNPNPAVLTDDLVAEARRRVRDGEKIADLAREWSLDCSALGAAVRGTAWKHVDPVQPPVRRRTMSPRSFYLPEDREALTFFLRRMVDAGATVVDAARNVGVADPTARAWLRGRVD